MRYTMLAAMLIVSPTLAGSKPIRVAIIDTGVNFNVAKHLCPSGHKDFTHTGLTDTHGHGTNVSGLIDRGAGHTDYCQVILKYYLDNATGAVNLSRSKAALRYAISMKVDFINYSGGGPEPDEEERAMLKEALDAGIKIVVAAGNENHNLNATCDFYPACYHDKRVVVVGNLTETGLRSPTSNYGNIVTHFVIGTNREVYGITMSGTSQATAIVSGRLINELAKKTRQISGY